MMDLNLTNAKLLASLCASLIALSSTLYFWLIRANRERAQLSVHQIGDLTGTVVTFFSDRAAIQRMQPSEGEHCYKYWLHLAIVNNSTLPNALLGAEVLMESKDGTWIPMEVRSQDESLEIFPLNLGPLTTSSLKLALYAKQRTVIQDDNQGRAEAAGDLLPYEVPIRIKLYALQNKTFSKQIYDSGNALQRTHVGFASTKAA